MKVCVLFNPKAGSAGQIDALRAALAADPAVTLRELGPDDDLAGLAGRAAADGFGVVAVAGGDGTVHAAASGLLAAGSRATLAVLPLGTGNDFCRTMGIPLDPLEAAKLLRTGKARRVDAVRVEGDFTGHMVNVVTGGFSGKVASEVTSDLKATWGPLAYLRGAVGTVADPPRYRLTLRFDGGPPEQFDALNVVIANARMAAGGVPVAPAANPEDGRLDVVIVRAGDALDSSVVAARLMSGDYTHDENVTHRLARRVEIASDPPLPVSIDGELREGRRFTFSVMPKALRVIPGPDYRPTADRETALEDEDEVEEPAPLSPAASPPPAQPRKGLRASLFGLLGGFLLLAKRTPRGIAGGLAVVAVAVLVFAWLASGAVENEWRAWDEAARLASGPVSHPELRPVAEGLTWFGGAWGIILVVGGLLVVFVVRQHYLTAATLAGVLVGAVALEVVLKLAFAVARPPFYPDSPPVLGYSFPSGHALRGVGVFGFLAAVAAARGYARRRPGWWVVAAGCVAVAVGVCWSRVYLGVHWPTDVIAGATAATAWVAACLVARHHAATRPGRVAVAPYPSASSIPR